MIEIKWEEYLERDDLKYATDELLDKNEQEIGHKLPESLRGIMKEHGGQKPLNLIPEFPNGKKWFIECIYHAYFNDNEDDEYSIPDGVSCLADEDYLNYVPFSDRGNVFLCLDYNIREIDPPVVAVIRDHGPDSPAIRLADNFDEFLKKYTVPMDQVER